MKKIFLLLVCVMGLFATSCSDDRTLDETRMPETAKPAFTLDAVTANKFNIDIKTTFTEVGAPQVYEYGYLISTEKNPTIENSSNKVSKSYKKTAETFTDSYQLSPATTYYVRSYAMTSAGVVYSEVKSAKTADHALQKFIGTATLTVFDLREQDYVDIPVQMIYDPKDETVLYMRGLVSGAAPLDLADLQLKFDLQNNKVTIPAGQLVEEKKFGAYQYVVIGLTPEGKISINPMLPNTGSLSTADRTMSFDFGMAALIVQGDNQGIAHILYLDMQIVMD